MRHSKALTARWECVTLDTQTAGTAPTRTVWPAVTAVWDCGPDALLPAPSQLTLRGLTRPGPGPRLGRLFMGGHVFPISLAAPGKSGTAHEGS